MYARLGLPDPLHGSIRAPDRSADLYRIDGVSRSMTKLALLTMINAETFASARAAVAAQIRLSEVRSVIDSLREASRILTAVERHFAAVRPFGSPASA